MGTLNNQVEWKLLVLQDIENFSDGIGVGQHGTLLFLCLAPDG